MLTIDASVWVNADSPAEEGSSFSRRLLDQVAATGTPVIVPVLLRIEVAAAISRVRHDPGLAREFSEKLAALPFETWVPIDSVLASQAALLAADQGLRGADAVYAAVAVAHSCDLISLDAEHLSRLASVLRVRTPAQVLAEQQPKNAGAAPPEPPPSQESGTG